MVQQGNSSVDDQDNLETERSVALESIQDSLLTSQESTELAEENEEQIDWDVENARLNFHIRLVKKRRRERWDTALRSLVVAGFFFSYTIIILIGFGIMSFGDNAFAIPSVVAAGVLETYGLAKLAIKYFFNDDDTVNK